MSDTVTERFAALVAFDWADQKHAGAVRTRDGKPRTRGLVLRPSCTCRGYRHRIEAALLLGPIEALELVPLLLLLALSLVGIRKNVLRQRSH